MSKPLHPGVVELLGYLKAHDHLPSALQEVKRPIGELAATMAEKYDGPELMAGLRKLLEASDCLCRAALPK